MDNVHLPIRCSMCVKDILKNFPTLRCMIRHCDVTIGITLLFVGEQDLDAAAMIVVEAESYGGVTFSEQTRGTSASRFSKVRADFEKDTVGKLVGCQIIIIIPVIRFSFRSTFNNLSKR